ncbi:transcriptional repressor [Cryobacterium sp. TMT1-21]|uniref:Transcriptional repressor n=1 Tax=Cryobacterium shii TaxID=1259235 RepID=A0AAQ2HEA5_9MICO|nr:MULTISPECIES: Fur family transcriptional regulator [Cryobacterium]TFC42492.1 transcriptional repressor [Cryobacterium shii]TFC80824.1 transcriptional repressor [Cryobacterium sp. TmT2-59]TFD13248.1 transcriptional repressor [Cryobacterium sp. TMT1-21]TFD18669.1 transcriptional repressor [Cryobacterium sp. TMT4-10]TFD28471.1 transcriptional repressor [Cryobacterium sp. TMT2-23]
MTGTEVTQAGAPEPLDASIRASNLKVTAPRLAVLRALTDAPHSTAERLFTAVRLQLPGTSLQAVYGVLAAFTAAGIARKIEPAGSSALFERRVGDNHHHIVCTRCNAVHDVDCAVGDAPCLTPANASGFAVHTAEVTYWGLCPDCQSEAAGTDPTPIGATPVDPTLTAPAQLSNKGAR